MRNIIKNIIILILLFSYTNTNAQRYKKPQNLPRYDYKKLHFGFTLGINELNFNIQKNSSTINNDTLLTLQSKSQKGSEKGNTYEV